MKNGIIVFSFVNVPPCKRGKEKQKGPASLGSSEKVKIVVFRRKSTTITAKKGDR
jgi:hypothetical protein